MREEHIGRTKCIRQKGKAGLNVLDRRAKEGLNVLDNEGKMKDQMF